MAQERVNRIGKYLLKSRLGKGGMGIVYLATDSRLKRDVALKVLPKTLSSDAVAVKRFLLEARVAARLSHPNVVTIHDVDQLDGLCFLVMELVNGGTAHDLLQKGPVNWWEATRIIADACRGLVAIHEAGLIHRDIKPSNIMLAANGAVKLADFGLAKMTELTSESNRLTVPNAILGTPQFMSPEQCQGEELDSRCDIYSLGATYYALLTGEAPFPDTQPLQCMFAHCSKPVPDPRRICSDIPSVCVDVVMKSLAKQRVDRFASAREMLAELKDCLNSDPTASSQLSRIFPQPQISSPKSSLDLQTAEKLASRTSVSSANGASNLPETRIMFPSDVATKATVVGNSGPRVLLQKFVRNRKMALAVGGVLTLLAILCAAVSMFPSSLKEANRGTPAASSKGAIATGKNSSAPSQRSNSKFKPSDLKPSNASSGSSGITDGRRLTLQFESDFADADVQVSGAVFSADGQAFYSGAMNGLVQKWSVAQKKVVKTYLGSRQGIRAIAAHGKWIAAGGEARTVWLWDADSDEPRQVLTGFEGEVSSLAISRDGSRLAVGTYSEVKLYQLTATGAELLQVLGTSNGTTVPCYMVLSLAFSADSRWVAITSWGEKTVAVWDAKTGELRDVKHNQADQPIALTFIPGEDRLVFGSLDQGLFVWDLASSEIQRFPGTQNANGKTINVRSLAVTPDGSTLLSFGEWGGTIRLYDLTQRQPPLRIDRETHASSIGLDVSPDGNWLLTTGGDKDHGMHGFIYLWKIIPESSE